MTDVLHPPTTTGPLELSVTDDIALRQLSPMDAPELFRLVETNRCSLLEAGVLARNQWTRPEDVAEYLTKSGALNLGIQSPKGMLGKISLRQVLEGAELIFWVDEKSRKQGIATNVVRTVVSYAFERQSTPAVRATLKPNNEASARVLLKNGFEKLPGEYLGWHQFSLSNPHRS